MLFCFVRGACRVDPWDIANAVVMSSFGKLLIVLMMVWDYQAGSAYVLNLFVYGSNTIALKGPHTFCSCLCVFPFTLLFCLRYLPICPYVYAIAFVCVWCSVDEFVTGGRGGSRWRGVAVQWALRALLLAVL